MPITKIAEDAGRFRRSFQPFANGRSAFKAILQELAPQGDRSVLLPAFIGWSSREGSGVLDPVRELGLEVVFYRVSGSLEVDVADLEARLRARPGAVVLLIHYFGRVDPRAADVARVVSAAGAELVEDEAHALLTDLVGGASGRAARHAFLSLHKLLPLQGGGAWIRNGATGGAAGAEATIFSFDLAAIAEARRRNHAALTALVEPLRGRLTPLWPVLARGEVPQTYPVVVEPRGGGREVRDRICQRLNELGFGAVSLYHTLVDAISPVEYPDSIRLSQTILNLPLHQDAAESELPEMVQALRRLLPS